MSQTTAFIGVGSNLNQRETYIQKALELISKIPQIHIIQEAPVYETDPVGGPAQGKFLNTVWEIQTTLSARELLNVLLKIESDLGRVRSVQNAPRTIDLDLLFYGDSVINEPDFKVPHPRLYERWFVLKPLWDVRADFIDPVSHKSVCELLDENAKSHFKSKKA